MPGMWKKPQYLSIGEQDQLNPPFRNVCCKSYEKCMKKAVRDNLYLACNACSLKDSRDKSFYYTDDEVMGCCHLLTAIFSH